MHELKSRRDFLKATLAGAGVLAAPYVWAAKKSDSKKEKSDSHFQRTDPAKALRVALIGCGGQGRASHIPNAWRENLVAVVDADETCLDKAFARIKEVDSSADTKGVRRFTDYREFFDKMGKQVDAIFVATTNNHHALPALMAMKLGIHCYVEKPMAYSVAEARQMAEFSKTYKVATQMGNQGHSGEGYRRLCEYIWAGAIGNVTEVHHYCNRANGGVGPRPPTLPVPQGMHWDNWIGPAPYRDFHKDLHPHEWHGWHDFGNGSLGNLGCHVMDGAVWALDLKYPLSAEMEDVNGGNDERYPVGTRVRWDFAARGAMPAVKVFWYDGKRKDVKHAGTDPNDADDSIAPESRNLPPMYAKLEKECGEKFDGSGTFYVGDKGVMYTATYGGSPHILPMEKHKAFPAPDKKIPRVKNHFGNFLDGCRGGELPCSNFEVAARLTEIILVGDLAIKAGLGKKIEWDGPNMRCPNNEAINKFVTREFRKGWTV